MRSRRNNPLPSTNYESTSPETSAPYSNPFYDVCTLTKSEKSISRLLLMSYFPSGFWSRLITRILADDQVVEALRNIYPLPKEASTDPEIAHALNISSHWTVWQTGLALFYGTTLVFKMREITTGCLMSPYRSSLNRFKLKQDGVWCDIDMTSQSILEINFPLNAIGVRQLDEKGNELKLIEISANVQCTTQLLALSVDHVDILLEDWYPTLGTRFVHTSEGRFLVTRLVPCPKCLRRGDEKFNSNFSGGGTSYSNDRQIPKVDKILTKRLSIERRDFGDSSGLNELSGILNEINCTRKSQDSLGWSDGDSGVGPDSAGSSRNTSVEGHPLFSPGELPGPPNYSWMVEECILAAYDKKSIACPAHGEVELKIITPDVVSNFFFYIMKH